MTLINTNRSIRRNQRQAGQGMTEYIIIVALIAIAAIGVYSAFGRTLKVEVAAITNSVAGNNGAATAAEGNATAEAGKATTAANTEEGMSNFANANADQ
jgi:Flp pilus assembly pilin Flp